MKRLLLISAILLLPFTRAHAIINPFNVVLLAVSGVIAALSCIALLLVLLLTVAALPRFGSEYNAPVNETADTAAQNMTANATSSHKMLETGNPILALFAVGAVLGAYAVYKRE